MFGRRMWSWVETGYANYGGFKIWVEYEGCEVSAVRHLPRLRRRKWCLRMIAWWAVGRKVLEGGEMQKDQQGNTCNDTSVKL